MASQKLQWVREEATKLPMRVLKDEMRKHPKGSTEYLSVQRIIRMKMDGCNRNDNYVHPNGARV